MGEPRPPRRTRTTVASLLLLLVISVNRADHQPGSRSGGGSAGIVSILDDLPGVLTSVARFIVALKNS